MEEHTERKFEHGIMNATTWKFDGIRMGHAVSKLTGLVSMPSGNTNDVVRMHFGLKGNYNFSYKQLNRSFELIGGHHNIMWSDGFDMVVENRTLELETFGIQFPKQLFLDFVQNGNDVLKRFSDQIIQGKSAMLSDNWGTIDPAIQQVIQQITHCKYGGDLKKLFLLSKSLELLVLSAEACNAAENRQNLFIKNKTDKEKIVAVRDLINERLQSPPNLSEIAKTVGLNEYKLKRGFKETFNNTVFGYLTERRLNLANQYLLDTQKTAAEIAFEMGYASPQHFNNAFKKQFGITPNLVRNNP